MASILRVRRLLSSRNHLISKSTVALTVHELRTRAEEGYEAIWNPSSRSDDTGKNLQGIPSPEWLFFGSFLTLAILSFYSRNRTTASIAQDDH